MVWHLGEDCIIGSAVVNWIDMYVGTRLFILYALRSINTFLLMLSKHKTLTLSCDHSAVILGVEMKSSKSYFHMGDCAVIS